MNLSQNMRLWYDAMTPDVRKCLTDTTIRVNEMRHAGKTIYPPENLVFNALDKVAPQDVRCVIIGQDPYHGKNQAMGLSFSVPSGVAIPPSLRNIYQELENDVHVAIPANGDLTPWTEQGVLLLNASLTVEAGHPNSHANIGWKAVTDDIVRITLELPQPIVYLLWGRYAKNVMVTALAQRTTPPQKKRAIVSSHPSPYSANSSYKDCQAFIGSRCFSKANAFLVEEGGKPIDWTLVKQ